MPASPASPSSPRGWAAPTSRRALRSCARPASPPFPIRTRPALLFNYLWRYSENLRSLYETPSCPSAPNAASAAAEVDRIIAAVSAEGRTILTEDETKNVLAAYGIPITDTVVADRR